MTAKFVSAYPYRRPVFWLTAAVFGISLIWAVGFSQIPLLHDTFHEARHALGLPCH